MIKPELLDIINFAICRAANDYLGEKAAEFFSEVGRYHLDEAIRRGFIKIESKDEPLDVLMRIAKYLQSTGYMQRIVINRLGEGEALVEMSGVSVTESSLRILKDKKQPSHYMTNLMFAALGKLDVHARLEDVEFDERKKRFREHWRII